jgi:protein TonB
MNENYIEKSFLYFLVVSLVLHGVLFWVLLTLPEQSKKAVEVPYMIDLQDLPDAKLSPPVDKSPPARRLSDAKRRVLRETAPKGTMLSDQHMRLPAPVRPQQPQSEQRVQVKPRSQQASNGAEPGEGETIVRPNSPASGVIQPRKSTARDLDRLFPSAGRLASLEESYRRKYGPEVHEDDTKFLNTDDIQFGSFLRRFENAIYGVWRYPQDAAQLGIEGVVAVRITFNRKGDVARYEILEGSGSKILDEEVKRTLKMVGPVGGFPKAYDKDEFHLIAFFRYSIVKGVIRGTLH